MKAEPEKLIQPHGGYRNLKSFQVAQLAYDMTVRFCDRYIEKRSRTHDQIIGRGTRLYDGKDYFTIYDFVKAHLHFSDPE